MTDDRTWNEAAHHARPSAASRRLRTDWLRPPNTSANRAVHCCREIVTVSPSQNWRTAPIRSPATSQRPPSRRHQAGGSGIFAVTWLTQLPGQYGKLNLGYVPIILFVADDGSHWINPFQTTVEFVSVMLNGISSSAGGALSHATVPVKPLVDRAKL